jgi:hypothetical protein
MVQKRVFCCTTCGEMLTRLEVLAAREQCSACRFMSLRGDLAVDPNRVDRKMELPKSDKK